MSSPTSPPEFWVDELRRKHECGGYHNPETVQLAHEGRPIRLLVPFPLVTADVVSIMLDPSGELLYLIAREPDRNFDPPYSGLLILAKRREPDTFATVVWHELYPWVFQYLGLRIEAV